jgi:GNAT superfamily N-acetyltransferase
MDPNLSTRPATPADQDFLWKVYAATRSAEVAAWGWAPAQQEAFLRMQFHARGLAYQASYPGAEHSIVLENGGPVGQIIVSRTAAELRLVDIALLPEHRNRGLGAHLISALIREADAAALPLRLTVARGNPAIHLYLRLGFASTSEDAMYIEMERKPCPTI